MNSEYPEGVALKAEVEWFRAEARKVFELLSLPVLQLLAAVLNFAVVAVTSRPMFNLPFNSLEEVLSSTPKPAAGKGRQSSANQSVRLQREVSQ